MAEGLLRDASDGRIEVCSAGTRPSTVRPEAITVMAEQGIDIAGQRSKHVDEFHGRVFDYVITVCDSARESCPVFPGARHLHFSFPDPAAADGDDAERLDAFRRVRDGLSAALNEFAQTAIR